MYTILLLLLKENKYSLYIKAKHLGMIIMQDLP